MRVADGHDGGAAEQFGEQPGLRHVGVLVLVEQHDAVPRADARRDLGVGAHDLQRERHLVGERHVALALLGELESLDEVAERQGRLEGRRESVDVGARVPVGARQVAHAHKLGDESPQVVDGRVVLGEAMGEAQHGLGRGVDGEVEVSEPGIRRGGDDVARKLPGARLAEHDAVGVAADEHRVVAVQARGEGVVGRHGRLREGIHERAAVGAGRQEPARAERDEARPDARGEFTCCLAREREPEHALGRDMTVGAEPQHARGHRLGLARAGSRDDEGRAERSLDDGTLLGGRTVDAECVGDRVCTDRTNADRTTAEGTSADRCARASHESSPVTGGTRCTRWASEP